MYNQSGVRSPYLYPFTEEIRAEPLSLTAWHCNHCRSIGHIVHASSISPEEVTIQCKLEHELGPQHCCGKIHAHTISLGTLSDTMLDFNRKVTIYESRSFTQSNPRVRQSLLSPEGH